jgi:DNA-directed RNA polymerase specialized sigma subunit
MCLPYDKIVGYLYHYAGRFCSNRFEIDELVNEAWIAIYGLETIEFASQGIRWAMLSYKKRQYMQDHRGLRSSVIGSIDDGIIEGLIHKNILFAPDKRKEIEDRDCVKHLLRNAKLSMKDRLLIDQRYYQGLSMVEMAKIHNCTKQNIYFCLDKIKAKLCA